MEMIPNALCSDEKAFLVGYKTLMGVLEETYGEAGAYEPIVIESSDPAAPAAP